VTQSLCNSNAYTGNAFSGISSRKNRSFPFPYIGSTVPGELAARPGQETGRGKGGGFS
jgi:hypothetical protein